MSCYHSRQAICPGRHFSYLGCIIFLILLTGCDPGVVADDKPYEFMEFDLEGNPPRVPEPTILLTNHQTGKLDFSVIGIELPSDCQKQTAMPVAQCEIYQYLESLDGYPTDSIARAPASTILDSATLALSENLLVLDAKQGTLLSDVQVAFDSNNKYLTIAPKSGWAINGLYYLGIRGYEKGVKSAEGREVVSSIPFFLFKEENSLTCNVAAAAEIGPQCAYYNLLKTPETSDENIFTNLNTLEATRLLLAEDLKLWATLEQFNLPKKETAMAWAFQTHSASVVELNPPAGQKPKKVSETELRLTVKGDLDPQTIKPFTATEQGSVIVLDVTDPQNPALPDFAAKYENSEIVLQFGAPLVDNHSYCLLLTNTLTNSQGLPLVPATMSALLRARGKLVDADKSVISGLSDEDAQVLEPARQQLAALLDDPGFQNLTALTREDLVFLYAFTFPDI